MASITIQHSHKNLLFAAAVANSTGAEFEEDGRNITIFDSPTLTIPHYDFSDIFDFEDYDQAERVWRSLLLNKVGYLVHFDDMEICISDDKPKDKRPQFLLRFPSEADKQAVEEWAERAGFGSLTEYILEAISAYNKMWADKSR